jgi:hypothetical protein
MYKFGLKRHISLLQIEVESFTPVFHKWIQEDRLPQHLMIDIADYKHIPDGPQIMLIAHEGHIVVDFEDNKPGIQYIRKAPLGESITDAIKGIKEYLDFAVELINIDDVLGSKIEFSDEYELISNNRFAFPNNKESGMELLQYTSGVFNDHILSVQEPFDNSRLKINIQ